MESSEPVHAAGLGTLSLAALGVVYGDIGTSPLYAMRESLEGHGHVLDVTETSVLGLLSLIFWSLVIVITIKYLVFVMRADNQGEGGILALTALVTPDGHLRSRTRLALITVGLFGTALLYGDGMITPAISVLSAVEGTEVATEALDQWVIPIACVILVGLFAVQHRGTASIGKVFGPVMIVWFGTLAALGVAHIVDEPSVLRALSPTYGVDFFLENGFEGFLALGSVFLVVTGGEALYADMGHFGTRPIKLGWFGVVLPGLVLNYFGQGALLLGDPEAIDNPFYRLVPETFVLPLVVLATIATIIASQALISGAFSLTMQAVQLGYAPRFRIVHTSSRAMGQIYIPAVNWVLMVACIGLVVGFRSSTALAAAYGVAVTMTMVITTVLFAVVARERFGWSAKAVGALAGAFLVVDLAFFGANVFKIPAGGWFPLVVGAGVLALLTTWRTGRSILNARISKARVALEDFFAGLDEPPVRVPGTAVYLFSVAHAAPPALIGNTRHNHVLHQQVVVAAIETAEVPRVAPAERTTVRDHGDGIFSVVLRYGFMEEPDVCTGLQEGDAATLGIDPFDIDYFLGSEQLLVTPRVGMAAWREHLFAFMSRNATTAANYFGIPPERTTIVGRRVEL
ncbi:MAG TPA: KUP/HAK/KT family potassium transporter [Acidimicrobiales bacterium]|nr:KUP/HAK/KT family potassium transporter [Acidimicrobiales bacterium]